MAKIEPANLLLKDKNGNSAIVTSLTDNDLVKIRTAVSDVALVVNQSNHTPIEATTTNKGVVQLATSADVVAGASDKVVTAEQLHNVTTGTSALATENLARIDAVITEAGIPIDHTNTNQLKTAVTTLISNAAPATATSDTVGVVKPDNDTITIDSNGVLTATAQMPGVATTTNVGVVKPDGSTITVDGNGTLTATAQMPGVATNATVGVVKPDGRTITITADGVISAIGSGGGSGSSVTGEIKWFAFNTAPDGYLVCNGANVSRTTYADLFAKIGTTFGSGNGSTTFALPNLIDKFAQGSTTVGTVKSAGLPNITGQIQSNDRSIGNNISYWTSSTGALFGEDFSHHSAAGASNEHAHMGRIRFNASNANSIYGNSSTVQPPALTLLPCIKY